MNKPFTVEISFWTEEEFIAFMKTFNNAIIAYRDILNTIRFGCELPLKWKPLEQKEMEDLDHDFFLLVNTYKELHQKEEEIS